MYRHGRAATLGVQSRGPVMRPLATGALVAGAGVGGVVNAGAGAGGGAATTGPLKLGGGSVSMTAGEEQPAAAMAQSEIVSREIFKAILGPLLFNDNVADDDDNEPDACPELPGVADETLRQILPSKRRST